MKHILLNLLNFFVLIFVVVFWFYPNIVYADSNASAQIIEIKSSSKDFPDKAGLKDEIIIKVINASMLNDEQFTTQKVILFFDGMPLRGAYPRKNSVDRKGNGELKFFIPHDNDAGKLWGDLLRASRSGEFFERKVCINVGLFNPANKQMSLVTQESYFTLVLVREKWFWAAVALLSILFIVFFVLTIKSDIIRDIGYKPPEGSRCPFSLAKTQMAVWTFVIISAWLLLYVFQHTLNSLSDSMAVLMGISSATGLGSVALEKKKNLSMSTKGFLKDILSDDSGVSFNRFQIFAWTIVMVFVFCRQVLFYFEMPEFDASLLVLMGISSGTYLGYKVTEKPVKPNEPAA